METTALRKFRQERNLTQSELAKLLGVPRPTAHRWETGERKIGVESLPLVSTKTGIPAKELRPDLAEKFGADQ